MTPDTQTMSGPELIDAAMASDDEALRDAALARIEEKSAAIKRKLDVGVSPAEFKRLESVQSALKTSHEVFATVWKVAKDKREQGEN